MATEGRVVDIDAAMDGQRLSGYQIAVIVMCAMTLIFDGFDNQTMGLLAPSIAKDLHLQVARIGIVFSSGLFGWMIGALAMGPVADRFGRRGPIIISALMFGLFTLLSTTATSLTELTGFWFLNGLGLGGAVPNALALATEFAPNRLEAKVAGCVIAGVPTGAILGGLTATLMLPLGGWRSVLYIGGVLPIFMAVFLMVRLPESPRFLIAVKGDQDTVKKIMRRLASAPDLDTVRYASARQTESKAAPVRELFSEGRACDTLLFWMAFFGNLMILYFVLNWFPAMLEQAGMPVRRAIIATTLYSFGGAVGSIGAGYLMEALGGRRATVVQMVLSALFIGIMARQHSAVWFVWIMSAALGVAVQGAQAGLNALAAAYYPTKVRSTGLGWALGVGRIGTIIGPLLGELMLSAHWSLRAIFLSGTIPAVIAALALGTIALRQSDSLNRTSSHRSTALS